MSSPLNKVIPQGEHYWKYRHILENVDDWHAGAQNISEGYWNSIGHPHRKMIIDAVSSIGAESVLEVGCASGPNIMAIRDALSIPDDKLAGIDVNEGFIEHARKYLPGVFYEVGSVTALPFENKTFDVVLTDAVLMYVDKENIKKAIREIERVAKKGIIFSEWYASSLLGVVKDFHWARDYSKLLKKWKVTKEKMPEGMWDSKGWTKHGYLFVATKE